MSTNNGVTPNSYDLIILATKNIKTFLANFHIPALVL
jgi:hypothetical protein